MTTAREGAFRNVQICDTGETEEICKNSKNDKNGDKNKNLGINFI